MKNIWVLEVYDTPETMKGFLDIFKKGAKVVPESTREHFEEVVKKYEKKMEEHPDGEWRGVEGKQSFKEFKQRAADYIASETEPKEFRVVRAKINEDAETWIGYETAYEDEEAYEYVKRMIK